MQNRALRDQPPQAGLSRTLVLSGETAAKWLTITFLREVLIMGVKTVVEIDLIGYSSVARMLEENFDAKVVAQFNQQIQGFVDAGLKTVQAERDEVVMATTGDGAILVFDDPCDAHHFGTAVHTTTQAHNSKRNEASAKRWFRIGMATGDLHQQPRPNGGQEIAGIVIANAVRMEAAARPGQIVADVATVAALPSELQDLYGADENVRGKRDEKFAARRCTVVPSPPAEDSRPTIESVLDLFDRLNPRDQLNRVMQLIRMPADFRPPDTLELFRRQDKVVDWATNGGDPSLAQLDTALKNLIQKQQSPRE